MCTYVVGRVCVRPVGRSIDSSHHTPAIPTNPQTQQQPNLQYFDYWTSDPRDPRSRIQLHHLLSFTSGYFSPGYGANVECFRNASMEYLDCVQELYETVDLRWEPGACGF